MTDIEFYQVFDQIPEFVCLDIPEQSRVLVSLFGDKAEYAMSVVFDAICDAYNAFRNVGQQSSVLLNYLVAELEGSSDLEYGQPHFHQDMRQRFLNQLITFEQTALDIFDKVKSDRLYIGDRFLPFYFQSLMPNGVVLLQRVDTFDLLMDMIPETVTA